MRLGNRTISVNLAVLHSVAQTVSLRLIGHKLTVCATARQRFKQARLHCGRKACPPDLLSVLKTPPTNIYGTKLTPIVRLGNRTYRG